MSGPSGVGKDSLLARLRERGVPAHYAITATTRPRRPEERDGVDYHFLTREAFEEMLRAGALLEHALVYGEYKGAPKAPLAEALARGDDVLIRVDVQGAASIRRQVPQAIAVFLLPDSWEQLKERLGGRGTEDDAELERRLAAAQEEMGRVSEFDYAIVNRSGALDEAVDDLIAIMRAERCRVGREAPAIV